MKGQLTLASGQPLVRDRRDVRRVAVQGPIAIDVALGQLTERALDGCFCPRHILNVELPIDPGAPLRWLDYAGRWMLLFATNKLAGNTSIADAVDLDAIAESRTATV